MCSSNEKKPTRRNGWASHRVYQLATLAIKFITIIAKPIAAGALPTLPFGNVPTRRAVAVVVVNALVGGLLCFVD